MKDFLPMQCTKVDLNLFKPLPKNPMAWEKRHTYHPNIPLEQVFKLVKQLSILSLGISSTNQFVFLDRHGFEPNLK